MLTDAANIIFTFAKRRCYTMGAPTTKITPEEDPEQADWDALDEIEGRVKIPKPNNDKARKRPRWLPDGMDPVLEELPKWSLVGEALHEIEGEIIRRSSQLTFRKFGITKSISAINGSSGDPGTDTVLIMTSSVRTSQVLTEFLSTMNSDAPLGSQGRKMMEDKLRLYLWWKGKLAERKQDGRTPFAMPSGQKERGAGANEISEALRRKDKERQARAANRRRVRGGGPSASSSSRDAGVSANSNGTSSSGHTGDNPESIAQL